MTVFACVSRKGISINPLAGAMSATQRDSQCTLSYLSQSEVES
jgi:hypothetical protein